MSTISHERAPGMLLATECWLMNACGGGMHRLAYKHRLPHPLNTQRSQYGWILAATSQASERVLYKR